MNHFFAGPLSDHARNIMRRLGYSELRKYTGQMSFTRRVGSAHFPRYHAYVEDKSGGMQVNLHVDQKEASYEGSHAHSGEYDGVLVEREMSRIASVIQSLKSSSTSLSQSPPKPQPKKSFVSKFFS